MTRCCAGSATRPFRASSPTPSRSGTRPRPCSTCSWRGAARFKERLIPPLGVATRLSTDVLAVEDTAFALALRFIHEHACHGITVEDVLQCVPLSRMSLERRFRKYLGRSPHAEIRAVQLARAKQLLTETEHSIHRIAQLVGFEHAEYFNVIFKRAVGQPPGRFRAEARSS